MCKFTVNDYVDVTQSGQSKHISPQHTAAETLLGGMTWTALTCSAGVIGYVIGEDIGVFTGALCTTVTGIACISAIQWIHHNI